VSAAVAHSNSSVGVAGVYEDTAWVLCDTGHTLPASVDPEQPSLFLITCRADAQWRPAVNCERMSMTGCMMKG
jgi:hypothetical protein